MEDKIREKIKELEALVEQYDSSKLPQGSIPVAKALLKERIEFIYFLQELLAINSSSNHG